MTAEQNNQEPKAHKSHFAAIASGAALTAVLALATMFNGFSHVPSEQKNKDQHDLLAPYAGFVMNMKNPHGSHCCGMQDGVGKIPEKHTDYPAVTGADGKLHADPNGTHYHVKLTKDQFDKDLPNGGFWMDIPDNQILSGPDVETVKPEFANDPTFKAPPFNILWHGPYDESSPDARPSVYCLWPAPRVQ